MSSLYASPDRYAIASQEDRSAPRLRVSIPGSLRPSGGRGFQTVIHDLSLSGFAAASVNRMHPGSLCWLTIPGLEAQQAEVVWWNASIVGCSFSQLLSPIVYDNLLARFNGDRIYRAIS